MSDSVSHDAKRPRTGGMGTAPPNRGPRDLANDRAVDALVRLLMLFFQTLPAPAARWTGRQLALLAWRLLKRKRQQMRRHMDLAFREEFTREQKEAWVRGNFEHIGLFIAEFARLPLLNKERVCELCDMSAANVFHELLAKQNGKGLMVTPAHHGNWELNGYAVSLLGCPLLSVARPLDNPYLNELVDGVRERAGNEIVHKWQILWTLKKQLDRGRIVTMSVDQNGGTSGIFVPLFGTLASTVASPAELALASGAPVIVATLNRLPDGVHHKFHVWDIIEFPKSGDHEADRRALLTRINSAYEKAIRAYPEQWLWGHQRWKTRPPGEQPGADGLPPRAAADTK
ncbi:MAG: lysophospholipid acyltransferase family protein [Planctomycetes bacterium]|nr:lysophospholipid acyltransferase family protein [Planctomycetota bacterium]